MDELDRLSAAREAAPALASGGARQARITSEAASEAVALQVAALRLSPMLRLPPPYTSSPDDALAAATPSEPPPQGNATANEDKTKHVLPPSVVAIVNTIARAAETAGGSNALLGDAMKRSNQGGGSQGGGGLGRGGLGDGSSNASSRGAGGESRWTGAPVGMVPESRIVVDLPESEFTYIDRPWSHFVTRWAAVDVELERAFGEGPFSLIDLGSCSGFFSLQAAAGYPQAFVVGVEGSVGIGNGTTGVTGNADQIIATKAVQTHLRWINNLSLANCIVAPAVWDYRQVCQFAALGRPICDVMLSLSVIHHIDGVSTQQYAAARLGRLEGTISLMAKFLSLAPRHFIELPDRPWMEHVYNAYGTAHAFLDAAVKASGRQWTFVGPLCVSQWYGVRELWLIEEVGPARATIRWPSLKALFPRVLEASTSTAVPGSPNGLARPGTTAVASAPAPRPPLQQAPPPPQVLVAPRGTQPEQPRSVQQPALQGQARQQAGGAFQRPLTNEELGEALLAAPTALIAAHVQLRDAFAAADKVLQFARPV